VGGDYSWGSQQPKTFALCRFFQPQVPAGENHGLSKPTLENGCGGQVDSIVGSQPMSLGEAGPLSNEGVRDT